jgi:hypothetical protein
VGVVPGLLEDGLHIVGAPVVSDVVPQVEGAGVLRGVDGGSGVDSDLLAVVGKGDDVAGDDSGGSLVDVDIDGLRDVSESSAVSTDPEVDGDDSLVVEGDDVVGGDSIVALLVDNGRSVAGLYVVAAEAAEAGHELVVGDLVLALLVGVGQNVPGLLGLAGGHSVGPGAVGGSDSDRQEVSLADLVLDGGLSGKGLVLVELLDDLVVRKLGVVSDELVSLDVLDGVGPESRLVVLEAVEPRREVADEDAVAVAVNSPVGPAENGVSDIGSGVDIDVLDLVLESGVVEGSSDDELFLVVVIVLVVEVGVQDSLSLNRVGVDGSVRSDGPEVRGAQDILDVGHAVELENGHDDVLGAVEASGAVVVGVHVGDVSAVAEEELHSHDGLVPVGPLSGVVSKVEGGSPILGVVAVRALGVSEGQIEFPEFLRSILAVIRCGIHGRNGSEQNRGNSENGEDRHDSRFVHSSRCVHILSLQRLLPL